MEIRTVSVLVKMKGRVKRKTGRVSSQHVRMKEVITKRKLGSVRTVIVLI